MRSEEKAVFLIILALLAAVAGLYAAYSLRLEREPEVYNVSLIMGSGDENFEKGVSGASLEYNADVHTVRAGEDDPAAQLAALERELQSGADAVILAFCDGEAAGEWLKKNNPQVPIVAAGTSVAADKGITAVSMDERALGTLLARCVLEDGAGTRAALVRAAGAESDEALLAREDALAQALTDGGVEVIRLAIGSLRGAHVPGVLIGLEAGVTKRLAAEASSSATIYGVGFAPGLREALESGRVAALSVVSKYDMGYLATRAAVERAAGKRARDAQLDAYTARPSSIYEPPVSTILFPIG